MSDERDDMAWAAWKDYDRIADHDNMSPRDYFLDGWRGGENARTPGPAADRLAHRLRTQSMFGPAGGCWVQHALAADFLAEHEAATKRGGIVDGLAAMREAGGKAWDGVPDVAEELGRTHAPDVSRLLAAAKAMLDAEKGSIHPHICDELAAAIAEHEAATAGTTATD